MLKIWNKANTEESFEEFASKLSNITSLTVLNRVKETVYDSEGHVAIVDKVIEEATSVAIICGDNGE